MRLDPERVLALVVDVQEKLFPHIANHESLAVEIPRFVSGMRELGVPIVVSEQYVKGLGPTIEPVRSALGSAYRPLEKSAFSCADDAPLGSKLAAAERSQILILGIEAHVCVYQSALDLLDRGHHVYVVVDGIGSRRETNRDVAVRRLVQAGALLTTVEMALFELLRHSGTDRFRAISKLVK